MHVCQRSFCKHIFQITKTPKDETEKIIKSVLHNVIIFLWVGTLISCSPKSAHNNNVLAESFESEYYVAAYIWPSCHHDMRFGVSLLPSRS